MTTKVKQWISDLTGVDNLRQQEVDLPEPGEDEVLVKMEYVSLNYRDTEVINGLYNHHTSTSSSLPSIVPCSDMSGTILSLGPSTSSTPRFEVSADVLSTFNQSHLADPLKPSDMSTGLGLPLPGVLSTHRVFPVDGLVAAPAHLTPEESCTLPIAYVTAWQALNGFRPLGSPGGKDESVLLQGTGGVSIAGLQFASALGFSTIIVTSSSDEKLARAKELGATHTINYRTTTNWEEEVLRITDGSGVDIIFELGGAATWRKSFECIKMGGLINAIGYVSGKLDPLTTADSEEGERLNINVLALRKNVTLKGILNGSRERFEEMVRFVEEKGVKPVVEREFAWEEVREGLRFLEGGGHFGKVVVRVGEAR